VAISLIVLKPKNEETSLIYVPIATEDVFDRIWLRGAEHVGAVWLPLFQSGVDISASDFEKVSQEVILFRGWIVAGYLNEDERNSVLSRIDSLLNELDYLNKSTDGKVVVFVG
jgi:hypothetical protein